MAHTNYQNEIEKIANDSNYKINILKRFKTHKFYKYMGNEDNIKETLENQYFYASKLTDFNDPFEVNFGFSERIILNEILKEFINKNYIEGKIENTLAKNIFDRGLARDFRQLENQQESLMKDIILYLTRDEKIFGRIKSNSENKFKSDLNTKYINSHIKKLFKSIEFKKTIYKKMFKPVYSNELLSKNIEGVTCITNPIPTQIYSEADYNINWNEIFISNYN